MRIPYAGAGAGAAPLALGGAPLGNLFAPVDDAVARATVDAAWEAGVRLFDTAPHYGLGLSERRMGAALRARPREDFLLCTKIGRVLEPLRGGAGDGTPAAAADDEGFAVAATQRRVRDYSRDGVLRSLADSRERLGIERIDIALVHDPDEHERAALDGAFPALVELRAEGVVGAIGAGMNQAAMLTRFVRAADLDVVLVAGRYTLLEQDALDDLLPACTERGVAVLAAGVFNSGLLARDRPAADATYDYAPAPSGLVARAHAIADVCERHGTTLPAAALAFPAAHPAVAAVLVGARSPEEIARNAALHAAPVPAAVWDELRAEGLLRADAPTPS